MRTRPFAHALLLFLVACGGGGSGDDIVGDDVVDPDGRPGTPDAHEGVFLVSGTAAPNTGPGPAIMFWSVVGEDYFYKLGDGTALAATFELEIVGVPPPEGRTRLGDADFGVGTVLVFPAGTEIPDGIPQTFPFWQGIDGQHAVIYRAPGDAGTQPAWLADFPIGMSCGRCVASPTGFDTFTPAACDAFAVETNDTQVCDWY